MKRKREGGWVFSRLWTGTHSLTRLSLFFPLLLNQQVEKSPIVVKAGMKKEEADELKAKLEAAGGKVSLE